MRAAREIIRLRFSNLKKTLSRVTPVLLRERIKTTSILSVTHFDITPYEKRISLLREIHPSPDHISVTFLSYIIRLLEEGRVASALNYQDAYNSLKKFKGNVCFADITVSYLRQYENWMINVPEEIAHYCWNQT